MNFHFVTGHNSDSTEPTLILATFNAQEALDAYHGALADKESKHEYITLFRNAEVTKRTPLSLYHSKTGSAVRFAVPPKPTKPTKAEAKEPKQAKGEEPIKEQEKK